MTGSAVWVGRSEERSVCARGGGRLSDDVSLSATGGKYVGSGEMTSRAPMDSGDWTRAASGGLNSNGDMSSSGGGDDVSCCRLRLGLRSSDSCASKYTLRTSLRQSWISFQIASRNCGIVSSFSISRQRSKTSGHAGSSLTSWYDASQGCSNACWTVIREAGSNTSNFVSKSTAVHISPR